MLNCICTHIPTYIYIQPSVLGFIVLAHCHPAVCRSLCLSKWAYSLQPWQISTGVAKDTKQSCQVLSMYLSVSAQTHTNVSTQTLQILSHYDHTNTSEHSVPLWPPRFSVHSLSGSLLISLVPSPLHWLSDACQKAIKAPAVRHTLLPLMTSDDTHRWSHPLEMTGECARCFSIVPLEGSAFWINVLHLFAFPLISLLLPVFTVVFVAVFSWRD